jgi:hypothetical protein
MSLQDLPLSIADALEHFNKAEPDLMVRDAFGHRRNRLCLAASFMERLEKAAELGSIPPDAWWAIEYPFTCLVGALALYAQGEQAFHQKWPNSAAESGRVATKRQLDERENRERRGGSNADKKLPRLATSGREDVDFIVSFENKIILLEAKGHNSNVNDQINSKLDRLELINNFYSSLPQATARPVIFRFILWSPRPPKKVTAIWPNFAKPSAGKIPHITLDLVQTRELFWVTRSDKDTSIGEYQKWGIKRKSRRPAAARHD